MPDPLAAALLAHLDDDPDALEGLAERLRPYLEPRGELLTPQTAAERLGVHRKTLTRAAKAGRVPGARRVGSAWRFDPATLALDPVSPLPAPSPVPSRSRARLAGSSTVDAIRNAKRAA